MKKSIFLLVIVPTYSIHTMSRSTDQALEKAIRRGDKAAVEDILDCVLALDQNPEAHLRSPLLRANPIDIENSHTIATRLAEEKKQKTGTLKHPDVYKRIGYAIASWLASGFGIGNYLWQTYSSGQWDTSTFLAVSAASGALVMHGINQLHLGVTNFDAHHDHAKQVAIAHLTNQAKEKLLPSSRV